MSIHPILEKIKALTLKAGFEGVIMIFIIILVGLAGFGLGKLSSIGECKPIIIQQAPLQGEITPISKADSKNLAGSESLNSGENLNSIIASKNGTKYYFSWCSGVGRIQDQNRVYFNSEKEAVDAGFSKASGCQ